MQVRIVIMRYKFFEAPFLFPKHATSIFLALEMVRQMATIETKYGSRDYFKPVIPLPTTIGSLTLIEANYTKEIENFIVEIFKLVKANDPWTYDLVGEFTQVVRRNNKYPSFHHEPQLHYYCYANQIDKQVEANLVWEFGLLKRPWLELESIKKLRSQDTK